MISYLICDILDVSKGELYMNKMMKLMLAGSMVMTLTACKPGGGKTPQA